MNRKELVEVIEAGATIGIALLLVRELPNMFKDFGINSEGIYHSNKIICDDGRTIDRQNILIEFPKPFSENPPKRIIDNPCRDK